MKILRVIATSLMALLLISACSTPVAPPLEVKDPKNGIIFGNVSARAMITEVVLHKYGKTYIPPFVNTPKVQVYPSGDFVAENLPPGKYYISSFISSKNTKFSLSALHLKPYQRIITVQPGSLKFAGSYQLTGKLVVDKRANSDEFFVQRVRLPGERDILRRLYNITEGTGWQRRIDRRLKELRV